MRKLSVFVDESGYFGKQNSHNPYYIVSIVFHDQAKGISESVARLNSLSSPFDMPIHNIHTAPLVRRDGVYKHVKIEQRRWLFNQLFQFMRFVPISYASFIVHRKHTKSSAALFAALQKQLNEFLTSNLAYFQQFDSVVVYYDNGQAELTEILSVAFGENLSKTEFRKVRPADYKLFQAADLICTLELVRTKAEQNTLSRSELSFFISVRELKRRYLRHLDRKKFR